MVTKQHCWIDYSKHRLLLKFVVLVYYGVKEGAAWSTLKPEAETIYQSAPFSIPLPGLSCGCEIVM